MEVVHESATQVTEDKPGNCFKHSLGFGSHTAKINFDLLLLSREFVVSGA